MDPSLDSAACDVFFDEWGECVVKDEDIMSVNTDGLLDGIQQNNPAISAVRVNFVIDNTVDDWDWAAAGNGIGSNRYLWFVYLRLDIREVMPHEDVQAFFGGLALNRSIQALSIIVFPTHLVKTIHIHISRKHSRLCFPDFSSTIISSFFNLAVMRILRLMLRYQAVSRMQYLHVHQ